MILITFIVSGIWHGAGFQFIFWGLLHAFYQITAELTLEIRSKFYCFIGLYEKSEIRRWIQRIGVFIWVTIAWILFRAEDLNCGLQMIKSLFTVHNLWIFFNDNLFLLGLEWKECCVLILSIIILIAVEYQQERGLQICSFLQKQPFYLRWSVYIFAILSIMIFGTYGYGFQPQDFIYGGF